jgi:hypothetical protein
MFIAHAPGLLGACTREETRPPELDTMAAAFVVAGENQETVADVPKKNLVIKLRRIRGQSSRGFGRFDLLGNHLARVALASTNSGAFRHYSGQLGSEPVIHRTDRMD